MTKMLKKALSKMPKTTGDETIETEIITDETIIDEDGAEGTTQNALERMIAKQMQEMQTGDGDGSEVDVVGGNLGGKDVKMEVKFIKLDDMGNGDLAEALKSMMAQQGGQVGDMQTFTLTTLGGASMKQQQEDGAEQEDEDVLKL